MHVSRFAVIARQRNIAKPPVACIRAVFQVARVKIFKPRTGAWMILAVLCAPLAVLGVADWVLNPSEWLTAVALVAGTMAVVCYNLTARLVIDDEAVTLKRYGFTVWRAPRRETQIEDGLAGGMPFIPALVLRRGDAKIGFVLKGWFYDDALSELRNAVAG
jgi:hypothetical protein